MKNSQMCMILGNHWLMVYFIIMNMDKPKPLFLFLSILISIGLTTLGHKIIKYEF